MLEIKNILTPIDFSDNSKKALIYALGFARDYKSRLHLVHVIEPLVYPIGLGVDPIVVSSMDTDVPERARAELLKLAEEELGNTVEHEIVVAQGKPFVEINRLARERDIDMIVMSTHGHTGVEHLLFGSTAEKVVRKAPCPVLTLRDPIKGYTYQHKKG